MTSNLEAASQRPAPSLSDAPAFFSSPGVVEAYRAADGFRRGEEYVFRNFLIQGGNLLELGCGAGRVTFLLARSFTRVDAIDLIPEMIDAARARQGSKDDGIRFSVGDATAIAAAPATYDNVLFAYNGIESIPTHEQRVRALREVHRVLKPGGRFVFSTKSLFTPLYLLEGALKPRVKRVLRAFGVRYPQESILPFGEIVWKQDGKAIRLHTSNPFQMKRLLGRMGFRVVYFNSEDRIARGRTRPSVVANFGAWDHFFVCDRV